MKIPQKFACRILFLVTISIAVRASGQGLVLSTHRGTGVMSIRNASAGAIAIDGYAIGSVNGFLNPANGAWMSFADANISGWEEANPTVERLSELNSMGSLSLAPGQIQPLGTPYDFAPTVFGNNLQNLTFEYATPGGGRFQGVVQYAGPHNNLVLTVDRTTGSATIQNQSPLAIAIDGYTIRSVNGFLNPANGVWMSFADANIGDWEEANPIAERLSELNPMESLSFAPGQAQSLGTPYDFAPTVFGDDLQNLTFEYATSDGGRFQGVVQYAGRHNNLVLTVDRTTGSATIQNQSPLAAHVDGYTIASASGSLEPVTWNSLADQNLGDWDEANPSANRLSELNPNDATTFTPSMTIPLGELFNPGGASDLTFEFRLTDGQRIGGIVDYVLPGDYNDNGVVDAADYTVWRDNLGTNNALLNNSIPEPIGPAHYNQWKTNFGATAGGAAGSLSSTAVPEPASLGFALLTLVIGGLTARTRLHNS